VSCLAEKHDVVGSICFPEKQEILSLGLAQGGGIEWIKG